MAFKRWNKSPSKQPPKVTWSEDQMKMIGWCLNKNIKIGISPDWKHDLNHWQIDISINDKVHIDPSRYTDKEIYNKVKEYYKYYYDKHNTQ
jgi:hypothetical protein